jgi:glucose/arabinose dehydrogenase
MFWQFAWAGVAGLSVGAGFVTSPSRPSGDGDTSPRKPVCAPDNAGLKLPPGFCALLVAESLGYVRHLAAAPNGDLLAARGATRGTTGGVLLLRDADGDGAAEQVHRFYEGAGGSGLVIAGNAVYFAPNDRVLKLPWMPGETAPHGPAVTVATGLPTGGHASKGLALRGNDLFVSFGSLSNSCQAPGQDRRGPHPGQTPCPELSERAGIWRFAADGVDQTPASAHRYGTGMRNPMAMAVEPGSGLLYTATHGRDQLTENWSWPAEEGRENPAEEFGPVPDGADYGWPYCFFNPRTQQRLQNPEYGGDGTRQGDCGGRTRPAIGFPAHWAPNGLLFYTGTLFPAEYRGGAFLAFHGSWNRAPAPQEGFRVVFIPFREGRPTGEWRDFALPAGAPDSIRPTGLAQGPDGSLYVGADAQGKIWRIMWTG